jgi:hypothetical protein
VLDDDVAELTARGTRFFTNSGASSRHGVRPAAIFADSASIGPSDAHTSRVR